MSVAAPLSHGEFSGHAAGLVLNHIRHEIRAELDVGASVASHVVVIGGGEEGEDLHDMEDFYL